MSLKVSIVGAGIAGLSLAWALTKRGVRVALFEQGPIPNPRSSSHDEHRITRHSYGALGGYGALMPYAFKVYEDMWADLRVRHFHPSKLLYVGRQPSDWCETTARDLGVAGIAYRSLTASEVAQWVPMLRTDGIVDAFESDGAGELFASRIVEGLAAWLREAGAELHDQTWVRGIDPASGRVLSDRKTYDADVVVVAAGAWVLDLLPAAADRLSPSRQTVLYLKPPARFEAIWRAAPVIVDMGITHGTYVLPPKGGTRLKIGDHVFTRRGTGSDDRVATDADVEPVIAAARESFVDFDDYGILEAKVCYYTVTADERFVVEPIGPAGWLLSACSGHGFKLGPLIASGLADALVGQRPAAKIPAWAAGKT